MWEIQENQVLIRIQKSPTEIIEHSLINKEYINHQNSSVISLVWTKNKYTGDCTSNR